MSRTGSGTSRSESYSPQRRTGLLLTGIGTAGAYHAGVLRALHEAGVKIDVVAGRGIGVIGALFMGVDGATHLWDDRGFWRSPSVPRLYPWNPILRLFVIAAAIAVALVVVPLAIAAAGLIVFPVDFVLSLIGLSSGRTLVDAYLSVVQRVFAPTALPTWLPRLVLIVLGAAAAIGFVGSLMAARSRPPRGPFWWRLVPAPLVTSTILAHCWSFIWNLLKGAAPLNEPPPAELGRRYAELLSENMGQPGFRELLMSVHDLDAGRDLVFALVHESRRPHLVRRSTTAEGEARRAEVIDLSGISREHFTDVLAAALSIPLVTEPHVIGFAADGYWRGERHRLCDRASGVNRLLEELAALDVQQVILVSASPEPSGPHALRSPRIDGRGRIGEYLQSVEGAIVRDAAREWSRAGLRMFTIRPVHNPVGPFDMAGGFDDRSARPHPLTELMNRGYEDAYHQFIEPVVGASGERVD